MRFFTEGIKMRNGFRICGRRWGMRRLERKNYFAHEPETEPYDREGTRQDLRGFF